MRGKRKVVILAAGQGSRIAVWNDNVPKPLLPLDGISLIERAITTAKKVGFEAFVIVVGFRGDEITSALGNGEKFGVTIKYAKNHEWEKSNGVSLLYARPYVEDEFALLMSDHVTDVGTMRKLSSLALGQDDLILLTDSRIRGIFDIDDATKVETENSRIKAIGKELSKYNAIDTGMFICSQKLFDDLEGMKKERGDVSLSEGVQSLAAKGAARTENMGDGWWQDVDTLEAFRHAEGLLRNENAR